MASEGPEQGSPLVPLEYQGLVGLKSAFIQQFFTVFIKEYQAPVYGPNNRAA